ncbi:aminotransferase class I/II-fold pyridoxal phosphate-dependent enzyme [Patescibacteria group bacterium]|nr:aminotransferase class I/II-fold pyridoxal phosphate-dependent enzyme [Patescibacteria group bacterium]
MKIVKSIEEYKIPYATAVYGKEEIAAALKVLKSRWLGPAKNSKEFESKMAELFGKKYGLFVNSGSSANLLALLVNKFPKGGEVVTPACTFGTTLSPILYAGLVPVFVDSEPGRYNPTLEDIEKAISKKTVAIMIPDTTGMLNDWPAISKLAKKKGVVVIQDSCDTQGAKINGKPSGSWSHIVTTSSYFTHTITTGGVGGTVMMNDPDLRRKAEVFATWGRRNIGYNEDVRERFNVKLNGIDYDGKFVWDELGFNLRATDMQAAFGLEQLKKINKFNGRRREVTKKLLTFFSKFEDDFMLPEFLKNSEHSLLAFPLSIRNKSKINRKKLLTFLELNRIQTRLLFTGNALFHPAFKSIPHRKVGNLHGATFITEQTFLLPNHHALTDNQLDYLFEKFSEYMKKNG